MNIEIINTPLDIIIHGFSGIASNKDYAGTAFRLMDKMWQEVKSKNLKNKGFNIWIYEPGDKVFAGVELEGDIIPGIQLEQKNISLPKYARHKHTGPYQQIKQAGQKMTDELKMKGFTTTLPYIEIYGHWSNDETKLETDLVMALL